MVSPYHHRNSSNSAIIHRNSSAFWNKMNAAYYSKPNSSTTNTIIFSTPPGNFIFTVANQVYMQSGKSYTFNVQCYSGGATYAQPIGSLFTEYISINYTDDVSGIPYTVYGKAIIKVSSSPTTSSTITTSTSSTTSSTLTTSSTSTTSSIQYIYCVGSAASPYTQVYYAPVSSTGIGTWKATTSYPVGMYDAYCEIPGS
ncbi:MAG: hypothetical protein QXG73_01480, partial [Candidatus Micrarchaeaceae archaeon]